MLTVQPSEKKFVAVLTKLTVSHPTRACTISTPPSFEQDGVKVNFGSSVAGINSSNSAATSGFDSLKLEAKRRATDTY